MLIKNLSWALVFVIVISMPVLGQGWTKEIDFKEIRLEQDLVKELIFYWPLEGQEEIEISLQEDFFRNEQGDKIKGERIGFYYQNNLVNLGIQPVKISIKAKDLEQGYLPFRLSFEFRSADPPGRYQNTLLIKTDEVIAIPIKFEILPWLKIENVETGAALAEVKNDYSLSSNIPLKVRIAGNVPWELSVRIKTEKLAKKIKLTLLDADSSSLVLDQEYQLLSSGLAVRSPNKYWQEITYILEIDDFRRLAAGKMLIPLSFRLQPLTH